MGMKNGTSELVVYIYLGEIVTKPTVSHFCR